MELRVDFYDVTNRVMMLEGQVIMFQEGSYHRDVAVHVENRWVELLQEQGRPLRLPKPDYSMLAVVTVGNGGHVEQVAIKVGSGSEKLDSLLVQAIEESTPLPAPPPELLSQRGQMSFDLRWEVTNHRPVQ